MIAGSRHIERVWLCEPQCRRHRAVAPNSNAQIEKPICIHIVSHSRSVFLINKPRARHAPPRINFAAQLMRIKVRNIVEHFHHSQETPDHFMIYACLRPQTDAGAAPPQHIFPPSVGQTTDTECAYGIPGGSSNKTILRFVFLAVEFAAVKIIDFHLFYDSVREESSLPSQACASTRDWTIANNRSIDRSQHRAASTLSH